jgi:hypothetical protein
VGWGGPCGVAVWGVAFGREAGKIREVESEGFGTKPRLFSPFLERKNKKEYLF